MRSVLLRLPDELRDRLHAIAESQERTISDVGIEVVRRGLADIAPAEFPRVALPPSV